MLGFIGSAKKSICDVLENKTSVVLVVGGAEESLYARPQSNKVILKKRYDKKTCNDATFRLHVSK